jgi:hypothetical protein
MQALLVALVTTAAITIGGTIHHADAQYPPPFPRWSVGPSLACVTAADEQTFLSDSQIFDLCTGAASTAPVSCFLSVRDVALLSELESISLCRCARSDEPVECYRRADASTTFSDAQIVSICSARTLHRLDGNCAPLDPYQREGE